VSTRGEGSASDESLTPIGESLDKVLRGLGTPGVRATKTVFGHWEELVGATVAAHARPVSLDHGCLLVAVDEPAWATRFRYEQATLLERFASELGAGVIERIDVRVTSR
jgi:predicted nucleic acid-binding Zn ribbon protein